MAIQIPLIIESNDIWDPNEIRNSLDDLFISARQFRSSKEYRELLDFISNFRSYSIFNALLVHVQMPGAKFVATAKRWKRDYQRHIKLGGRPLVILKPMGPVMFVFDVSDTEPEMNAPSLPEQVTNPFAIKYGYIRHEFQTTCENAEKYGVEVVFHDAGALAAGRIQTMAPGKQIRISTNNIYQARDKYVPVRYGLLIKNDHSLETKYATLVHELAHLFCGHLGSPDKKKWPDRRYVPKDICELEAESVCYLVCQRLGIGNPSEKYLSAYVKDNQEVINISLDSIIKAATHIEKMGKGRLPG